MKKANLQQTIKWKPITDPPKKSGYVLLAITHHNIPMVLMGFCKLCRGELPVYKEEIYHGTGVAITHWADVPNHPYADEEGEKNDHTD
jgi:hypothetical protein